MTFSSKQLDDAVAALERTAVRPHMGLAEAVGYQFRLVDTLQQVMGSDEVFLEDAGQARDLAAVGFGGGGRPHATARVEEALATFFGTDQAVLVHGAGTGAIRAMLNAALSAGDRVVVHNAHPYKTTLPSMRHMGLDLSAVNFNREDELRKHLAAAPPDGVYVQHVPQQLDDTHDVRQVIALVREECGDDVSVLIDDNYAVMRSPQIGPHIGADASAFSLFKLLAPVNIGCVLGPDALIREIRQDLSSAGCQVQGREAMEAVRSLVNVPVALAIQNQVVIETAQRIHDGIAAGAYPYLRTAVAAQPGIRSVVVVFDRPIAEVFVNAAWRHGSPSRSVGEEARYEFLPLFTYLTSTFLKATPGLEQYAIRINPMRGGTDTILRILESALRDREVQDAARAHHDRSE